MSFVSQNFSVLKNPLHISRIIRSFASKCVKPDISRSNKKKSKKTEKKNKLHDKCADKRGDGQPPLFKIQEVERFIRDCCVKGGCSEENAEILADLLTRADMMNIKTHGLNRLEMYLSEVSSGVCDGKAKPTITKETVATALINGNNGMGHVIAKYAMNEAIKKAKAAGVGMTACYNGNHYGVAGLYILQAIEKGFIGLTFTNTSPLVVPLRAKKAVLGTNPFSIGAPGGHYGNFVMDISSSGVALGKVEIKKKLGLPLPKGWAINADGSPASDPVEVLQSPRLLPLGASENVGHLGYGYALMIDMITGILSGAKFGPFIKQFRSTAAASDLGYSFIAIDPDRFAPNFIERFGKLLNYLRSFPQVEAGKPVIVAGDLESQAFAKTTKIGGIDYNETQLKQCEKMAKDFKVKPLTPFN